MAKAKTTEADEDRFRLPIKANYGTAHPKAGGGPPGFVVAAYSVERNDYIHVALTVEQVQSLTWEALRFLGENAYPVLCCPTCQTKHKPECGLCSESPGSP